MRVNPSTLGRAVFSSMSGDVYKRQPGASRELVNEAGLYADRLSVNVEIPKEENLLSLIHICKRFHACKSR